jgi:NADPH2:quinone reductase
VRHWRTAGPTPFEWLQKSVLSPKGGEVRVRVLAAGVALPDLLAREGVHPETPPVPFTPGWDLVGWWIGSARYLWDRTRPDSCRNG